MNPTTSSADVPRAAAGCTQGAPWQILIRSVIHPGRPPAQWLRAGVRWLLTAAVACAAIATVGAVTHGDTGKYFGEKKVSVAISSGVLFASAWVCFGVARRLAPASFSRFWFWSTGLFAFLGLDDMLRIHEHIDALVHHAADLDPEDRYTDHLDDVIVASYALPALWLWFRFRRELVRLTWMVLTLGVAFAGFCAMVLFDVFDWSTAIEDSLKILSGTLILVAFLAAYHDPQIAGASSGASGGVDGIPRDAPGMAPPAR